MAANAFLEAYFQSRKNALEQRLAQQQFAQQQQFHQDSVNLQQQQLHQQQEQFGSNLDLQVLRANLENQQSQAATRQRQLETQLGLFKDVATGNATFTPEASIPSMYGAQQPAGINDFDISGMGRFTYATQAQRQANAAAQETATATARAQAEAAGKLKYVSDWINLAENSSGKAFPPELKAKYILAQGLPNAASILEGAPKDFEDTGSYILSAASEDLAKKLQTNPALMGDPEFQKQLSTLADLQKQFIRPQAALAAPAVKAEQDANKQQRQISTTLALIQGIGDIDPNASNSQAVFQQRAQTVLQNLQRNSQFDFDAWKSFLSNYATTHKFRDISDELNLKPPVPEQ